MSGRVEGFGSITWWGFSPAMDLTAIAGRPDCHNILVVGSGDLRHVLMTIARSTKPLHFYVAESSLELLARHMLFLTLASEPLDRLGLQERSELFLELYGNTLLRHQTSQWLSEKASELIKMVTDLDYQKKQLPILDLSLLKFKERDMLEGIFKFWRLQDTISFDITKLWEGRLRHHLGTRYDSRSGVFDWDYHMKLHDMAEIVSSREYQLWREGGVAFQLRDDAPYQHPNRTLASGLVIKMGGEKVARRGYWGDIVNSPYLTFGLESENKDLFCKANTKHTKSSVDVSVWNTQWLLGQLAGADHSRVETHTMPSIKEVENEEETETELHHSAQSHTQSQVALNGGDCCITFLPLNSVQELGKKAKYKQLFDIMYFSNSMVHHLESGVEATFSPHSALLLETARFMLEVGKEQRSEYIKKVTAMAQRIGYISQDEHHRNVDDANHLVFTREKVS